jgi:hypothetical protein
MRTLILVSLACLLLGCQKPGGRWRATEDVTVFKDANEANELQYIVKKGDVCALGKERVVKVFMYREIVCGQLEGWVMYDRGYPFEKMD